MECRIIDGRWKLYTSNDTETQLINVYNNTIVTLTNDEYQRCLNGEDEVGKIVAKRIQFERRNNFKFYEK